METFEATARLTNADLDEAYRRLVNANAQRERVRARAQEYQSEILRGHIHRAVWPNNLGDVFSGPVMAAAPPRKKTTMKEIVGNLWEAECDSICITTNLMVTKQGLGVMGAGCAKELAERCPSAKIELGSVNACYGGRGPIAWMNGKHIFAFPTKPARGVCNSDKSNVVRHMRGKFEPGHIVPGWACVSSIDLIVQSAHWIKDNVDGTVAIPRPGCGCGGLDWERDVKPLLAQIFDSDRFHIYSPA